MRFERVHFTTKIYLYGRYFPVSLTLNITTFSFRTRLFSYSYFTIGEDLGFGCEKSIAITLIYREKKGATFTLSSGQVLVSDFNLKLHGLCHADC